MNMIMKRCMINLAAILVSMAVWAVDGTWIGTNDGRWNDTANWQGGAVAAGAGAYASLTDFAGPVAITNDVANLKLQALTMLGGSYSLYGLPITLEGNRGAPYGLYVNQGNLTIHAPVKVNRATRVVVDAGARLTTTGVLDYFTPQWIVKYNPGEWCFEGSCVVTNAASYLGVETGTFRLKSGAVFTLRGGSAANFPVGRGGTSGRVVVESGAELNIGAFLLGYSANSRGTLQVDGGRMTANYEAESHPAVIGSAAGAHSSMSVSNNAIVDISNWLNVGASSRGELSLGSGANMTIGRLSLGLKLEETSTLVGPAVVKVNDGMLTVANQFVWRASGPATRTNIVTVGNGQMDSARLTLPATVKSAANQSFAKLTLDGGALEFRGIQDSGYNASLTDYLYGLDQFLIGRAGAVIDSSNLNATVTQTLQPDPSLRMDGGLIKSGSGMLTLAGGVTYAGPTVVAQGMLRLQGALPTGAMTVAPDAGVSLVDGQFGAFAPSSLIAGIGGESTIELEAGAGNVSDSLILPVNAQLENVVFTLVGLNGVSSYWLPGDYVIASYAGSTPDVTLWRAATPTGVNATFEVQPAQKSVVMRVTGVATGSSVWLTPGSGVWSEAANWNTAPANDPGTKILFGTAPGAAAHVDLGSAVTLGSLTFDALDGYTLAGAGITFGSAGVGGTLTAQQGAHGIDSHLSLPADLAVTAQSGASLLLNNGVSGAGCMTVTGGGKLMVADGAGFAVPLTLNNATLGIQESSTLASALTVGTDGATLLPAYGKTVTFSGAVAGSGSLTKDGASVATMTGANTRSGGLTVRNGTLEISTLTEGGDLVIGEGTLKYTGADVTTDKGLTIQTSTLQQSATFETDANVILNGNIWAESGSFMKMGKGTVTLAGTGENLFGNGHCVSDAQMCLDRGVYGESPTHGFVQAYIADGKLVLGGEGQINRFTATLVVGGETTFDPGAETAAHLEINGGRTSAPWVAVGRGNGSAVTAPDGLVSSLRLNGGDMTATGLWLGSRSTDMATITARPLFEMNDGVLVAQELQGGSDNGGGVGGGAQPRLVFNGGTAVFAGSGASQIKLARGAGTQTEVVLAGGTMAVSNTVIRLAENAANAKGTIRLNAGRLITQGLTQYGSGTGEIFFNGGVLQPCLDMVLSGLTAATVQAGGLKVDVPQGISLTLAQTLTHDADLGATPDGGVVKLGGGTLVLGGEQGYTGPTIVSGGVLRVNGQLAVTNLTLASGTTLSLTNSEHQVFAVTNFAAGGIDGAARIELDITSDGSAHDVLSIPGGMDGSLMFCLFKTGTTLRFVRSGQYPLVTFSGDAPDTSKWSLEGFPNDAGFEVESGTVYVRIGTGAAVASVWTNPTGGAWSEVDNWSAAPANDASANVLFGDAITAPASVTTGSGKAVGYLAMDSLYAYTWSGGELTLGSLETNATVRVARGAHVLDTDLAVPSSAAMVVDAGATLTLNGAITGAGSLGVTGNGTLSLTNGPAMAVPLTLDGVTLTTPNSTVFDAPFTLGAAGAVVTPAAGTTLTLTSPVMGAGGLTKTTSSILALTDAPAFAGELVVRKGTVEAASEPDGALVIGEGTFRYTGSDATFVRGYTLRTSSNSQAATFESDADVTFAGPVTAVSGTFIKLGSGTLTYAYAGENTLSAGDNVGSGSVVLNRNAWGDSPTQGYRSYNVFNGKVVLGKPGQTNRFAQAIIIGGESTLAAGAETAAHMEINGGRVICEDFITVGRGNGSVVTAPEGLESSFTLNDGEVTTVPRHGVWMGAMLDDMTTLTARPRFIVNGGSLSAGSFYCGNGGGTPRPRIEINGGMLMIGPHENMRLARCAGCETVLELNNGSLILTNQTLNLAENYANAKGTLNLNGGLLSADAIYQNGSQSLGIVNFNGGVFQQTASASLQVTELNVLAGGAVFEVLSNMTCTVATPLIHGEALGAELDGGLVKLGAGVLALSSENAYNGATIVSNGILRVMSSGRLEDSSMTIASSGLLSVQVASGAQQMLAGLTLEADAGVSITAADWAAFASAPLVVTGDVILAPADVQVLSDSDGVLTNGTYVLLTCNGTISGDPALLRMVNGAFGQDYTFTVANNELRLNVGLASSGAVWISATGGGWAETGNWATAPGEGAAGMLVGFTEAIVAPASVNVTESVTVGEMVFNNQHTYTLTGSGSATLIATNEAPAAVTVAQGTHIVTLPIELPGDVEVTLSDGELQLMGEVSGAGGLSVEGDGRLLLSGVNTYTGGTTVRAGVLDVQGARPLGFGDVVLSNYTGLATKDTATEVSNDLDTTDITWLGAYAPLTLSGDVTLRQDGQLKKVATEEMVFSGKVQPVAGATSRLSIRNGSVRFAAGADALFKSETQRNTITFEEDFAENPTWRGLTVETGAKVEAGCMYVGLGVTNAVEITGGELVLSGSGAYNDALLFGGNRELNNLNSLVISGGRVWTGDETWSLFGFDAGLTEVTVGGGLLSLAKVSFGVRDDASYSTGTRAAPTMVWVSGGLFEARASWNWMADKNGARLNEVRLEGGALRLPATYATTVDRLNQTRLVFNGGVLETSGGGIGPEDPSDYLKGLKQAYVGIGGAVIDTRGRNVALTQRLTSQDPADGGVVKRGWGMLSLIKPCVNGLIDVQAGTLKLKPEESMPYPDDPMVRLSFENGILQDDSVYNNNIELRGSFDNLDLIDGVHGTNALGFNAVNALHVNYRDDMKNADCYTVSAWVRQSAYQPNNQRRSFFGNMTNYAQTQYGFLLRIMDGDFRMIASGQDNVSYGQLIVDVVDALPLDTWKMLTLVVDGLNGFSMYVNGEKRVMRVNHHGEISYTDCYGAGKLWMLQPTARTGGKAFNIGAVATSDTVCFVGDLDDVTVYRRALNDAEIALLYQAKVPFASRVRVASGASLHLAGAAQSLAEVTGEGSVGHGTAIVTDALNPGDFAQSPAGAQLNFTDNLTLGTNVTYICDWAPEKNDLVDVWGTLTVSGTGTIDLGLTDSSQMPGAPHIKSFPVMYYTDIIGAENFSTWQLSGVGCSATASVVAADGVVTVTLDIHKGTLLILR